MSAIKLSNYDSIKKVWSGRKYTPIYNTDANLGYLILQRLHQAPQNTFQVCDDSKIALTNFEIYSRTLKFANFLTNKCQLKQHDVVGVIAMNSENLTSIIFACFTLGVAVNPLTVIYNEQDICHMWSKTRPKVIFSDVEVLVIVKNAVDEMKLDAKIFSMTEKVEGFASVSDILEVNYDIEDFGFPDLRDVSTTTALILCSSGTTDLPKGVCKSHKQVISQLIPFYSLKGESHIELVHSTSFWVSYFFGVIISALYGHRIVITRRHVSFDLFMDIVERHQVNFVQCAPYFGVGILNSENCRPMTTVKAVGIGGSVFYEELLEKYKNIFPNAVQVKLYGATEHDLVTMVAGNSGTSSGYPFNNSQFKIINEIGCPLGPNEHGEICVKTAVPFSAYFDDPDSYKQAIDASGFIKTGDVGYFDELGRIFVIDRIKHMIEAKELRITPLEVEKVINEIDGVFTSCVVGAFDEDLLYDIVYAFVIKDPTRLDVTEDFVKKYVAERNIETKTITGEVIFVKNFPKTPSGKVKYREMKKQAKEIYDKKRRINEAKLGILSACCTLLKETKSF